MAKIFKGTGDVQIFELRSKIYPVGGKRRPRSAKNAPPARFLYAPRPVGFESPSPRQHVVARGFENRVFESGERNKTSNGGERGIRTPGALITLNGFQDRRIKPLCHLSVTLNDSIE